MGLQRHNSVTEHISVQSFSCVWLFVTPKDCSTLGLPVHHQLLKLAQIHVHRVGEAIQSSHPPSSPFPPVLNLSQHQGLFQWVGSLHQVDKVLELQLQHQSFHEYSGLIYFRMDWFDLAVQGTVKSLLHHQSLKAPILQCSAFYMHHSDHFTPWSQQMFFDHLCYMSTYNSGSHGRCLTYI